MTATAFAGAQYLTFYEEAPQETGAGLRSWYARAQNVVLVYSDVDGEVTAARRAQPDEYALLLPDESLSATIEVGGEVGTVRGPALAFVPPGDSTIAFTGRGRAIRLFTTANTDLAERAGNAEAYREPHPHVAPLTPWPEPVGGLRLRVYELDSEEHVGSPFQVFRCTSFMVNYLPVRTGPRDPTALSPHAHDDFEQCSLVLDGEYTHHIRWPWTKDSTTWREDEHVRCGAPSLTVIPPPSVHTSQAIGSGPNRLIDIFSPPRHDFSAVPGRVLNAADYPMPDGPADPA